VSSRTLLRAGRAAKGTIIANIDPGSGDIGPAFGKDRNGGVIAMQTLGAHHIGSEALNQRRQRHGAMTDLVCKGRQAELDAFAGIALRLPVEGLVLAILLKQDHGEEAGAGPATRHDMEWSRCL